MELAECFRRFGGDYEETKKRLYTDELVTRMLLKFLEDPNYKRLSHALEEEDFEDAFEAVHALKGVSRNLGFSKLATSSDALTELLRGKTATQIDRKMCVELWQQVARDYAQIMDALLWLQNEMS